MSPQEMVAWSHCDPNCPKCVGARTAMTRWAGLVVGLLGLVATVVSVPVDGPYGVALGIGGIAGVWSGWSIVQRGAALPNPLFKALDLALWSASIGMGAGGLLACFGHTWVTALVLGCAALGCAAVWFGVLAVHKVVTRR